MSVLRQRKPIEVVRHVSKTLKEKTGLAYTEGLGLAMALDLAANDLTDSIEKVHAGLREVESVVSDELSTGQQRYEAAMRHIEAAHKILSEMEELMIDDFVCSECGKDHRITYVLKFRSGTTLYYGEGCQPQLTATLSLEG